MRQSLQASPSRTPPTWTPTQTITGSPSRSAWPLLISGFSPAWPRSSDAEPWNLLLDAAARGIMVAAVPDRAPPGAEAEASKDLWCLLDRKGLDAAQLFII